jgi:hypothetical protein
MQDIIDKLKSATGPSRHIDADIAVSVDAAYYAVSDSPGNHQNGHVVEVKDGKQFRMTIAPYYTASLDAAVKLIPDGLFWLAGMGRTRPGEPLAGASVVLPNDTINPLGQAEGDHLAICICIAALEARSAIAAAKI